MLILQVLILKSHTLNLNYHAFKLLDRNWTDVVGLCLSYYTHRSVLGCLAVDVVFTCYYKSLLILPTKSSLTFSNINRSFINKIIDRNTQQCYIKTLAGTKTDSICLTSEVTFGPNINF